MYVNETFAADAGVNAEHAMGDGWIDLVHPEDRQRVVEEWYDATIHGRNHAMDFRFLNKTTGIRWVTATAETMLDDAGKVTGYIGIVDDITDRKAVEEVVRASEMRLRAILDNMPAVISLKDLEGRYVLVNRGFEDLLGVKNDEIVGLTNYELNLQGPLQSDVKGNCRSVCKN